MKLPPIQVSLPLIFIVWCIVGVYVHGWAILAYPAMWGAVGLIFLVLNLVLGSSADSTNGSSSSSIT